MVIYPSGSNQIPHDQNMKIDGVMLTRVPSCKFLGITLDECLSFKHHISRVNQKVPRHLFNIKQLKFTLPKDTLRTLYFALIHPHLTYGILAWGNSKATYLHKTEMLQKRAIRTINNKKYNSHTDPLFKESGVLKMSDLYRMEILLFMHDYINDKLPVSFRGTFSHNRDHQNAYNTRQWEMFNIPRTKSRFVDKLPLIGFPSIWNKYAGLYNPTVSRNCFKRNIKISCFNEYKSLVDCNNPLCLECRAV